MTVQGEPGVDLGSLTRELVNCFWDEMENAIEGRHHKVPKVIPCSTQNFFQIGRFISHSYLLTGFIPLILSSVVLE